jgi:aldehyde:ferredoxin oxidoreductase
MGRLLAINLGTGEVRAIPLPDWFRSVFVGGKGFGAKLLYDLLPPGEDPFSSRNPLLFLTGPLTGTLAPAMRACVVTKSPLTGIFLDSYFGGHFGQEIKYAGYDGLIILGRASEPVYLWIENDVVEIRPASDLWGLDTFRTSARIKEALGDQDARVACIGPAGENRVRYALISCDHNRQAGRGGAGAVMGSKNLKAIVIRGHRVVRVQDPPRFREAMIQARAELRASEEVRALTEVGTPGAISFANELGLLPCRNYADGSFDRAEAVGDRGQSRHLWLRNVACSACPVACGKLGRVRTGPYRGTPTDVEYESAALLGSNLMIGDTRALGYLCYLCDALGLDSMSSGGVIGFAMEAAHRGLIQPDYFGQPLAFGNMESAAALIGDIAHRRGSLANLLAEGVRRAAAELKAIVPLAQHIKGLECPAWGPRGAPGIALALMTADRGGCHQRALPLGHEFGRAEWQGRPVEQLALADKASLICYLQNYLAGLDTLVKCDFGNFGIALGTYVALFNAATGEDWCEEDIPVVGERIWNLIRRLNLREGLDPASDTLPRRFMEEPLPNGPSRGHRFTHQDLDFLRGEYYRERGWDGSGRPTTEKLRALGLEDLPRFLVGWVKSERGSDV